MTAAADDDNGTMETDAVFRVCAGSKKFSSKVSQKPCNCVLYNGDQKGGNVYEKEATVETTAAYDAVGNYVLSQTDARGKTLTTVTDTDKGTTESVTDPNGQVVNYTYDTLRRVTEVSTQVNVNSNAENIVKEYKNEYTYNVKDRLTEVRHNTDGNTQNDVVYHFGYDALGRQTTVSVGAQNLSTTEYQTNASAPNYGTVSTVTYANGFAVHNDYDAFNRVTGICFGNETDPRYAFRYNARGQAAWMKDNLLHRVTETEYDLSDRPCRIKTHENGMHLYTGEVAYDKLFGNLSEFTERVGEGYTEYKTTFGYDAENRPTTLTYGNNSNQSTVAYDGLGRVSEKGVKVNGHEYTTAFAYAPGAAAGKTTGLISGITQTGENFSYTYDDVGNIASVTHNGKVTAYSYDPLGQLIRVNDQDDLTSGTSGTTWTYEYDQGGNILSKKRYAYTEASDLSGLTPLENDAFSYADANWRDKLTAYNGAAITYDAIGNPLNDGTWEYTWVNGRQLASMRKLDGSLNASFVYNSEGLRVQKTVNGVVTKYILHGKNITHLIRGNNELHFFYDASGSPAMVEWNNGTTTAKYAYVKNLQGDIIAIIDDAGAEVVKYTYDAWGAPVSITGTISVTLGILNPFRYRGYVFDDDMGLYYLRSRYYDFVRCKFEQADTFASIGKSIFTGNVFVYCGNDPVNRKDPTGQVGISALLVVVASIVCTMMLTGCSAQPSSSVGSSSPYIPSDSIDYNCYAYVLGETQWKYVGGEPGTVQDFSVDNVANMVLADAERDGRKIRSIASYDSPIQDDEYRIALRTGIDDYHFMVQHDDETWSHKPGICSTRLIDGPNPSNISWDLVIVDAMLLSEYGIVKEVGCKTGYYDSEIKYFAVTK